MMATYFNGGSEIQSDNLQTLYLMNRGYASYSDASQQPPGVLLLNHGGANALPQGSPHLVGIPLAGTPSPGDEISAAGTSHGQLVPRYHYNLWGGAADGNNQSQIPTAIAIGNELGSPMGFRRPAPVSLAATSSTSTLDHHHHHHHHHHQQQGGLSLSLNNSSPHKNVAMTMTVLSPGSGTPTTSAVTNGFAGYGNPSVIMGSKFLKAAQQLLDEVVNVGKAIDSKTDWSKDKAKAAAVVGSSSGGGGGDQLTTAQRQELQMKKAKLLNMLDEVEQRYRQYHGQMQMVAESFEQAAGAGSARSYTALALQTISKQFRCLKDAIETQIKATGRSMGEEEEEEDQGKGRSRLRMVDHQLRQQRALQQLGMMHHNAWRPQRGLPERAVSVLRAWLFEHFLHPYPKDSDKHILAKQTGLTRSQVSNWFINARVRLWKPMVEEMYVEEMKSHEQNNSENTTTPTSDHNQDSTIASKSTGPHHSTHHDVHHELVNKPSHHNFNQNPQHGLLPPPSSNDVVSNSRTTLLSPSSSNGPTLHSVGPLQGFSLVGSEMDPMSPKRQRMMIPSDVIHNNNNNTSSPMDKEIKPGGRDLFPPDLGGFGSYPIGEIGSRFNPDHHHHHLGQQQQQQHQHRYHHGNAVSLTLGLPHDSDQSTSLAGNNHHHHHQQQNFLHDHQAMQLGRRALEIRIGEAEICGIATSQPPPHSANGGGGYEEMNDVQNRKRFAAQLLPDFVT